jgi:hypothetical protein
MKSIYIIFAMLGLLGMVPALYIGAWLAALTHNFLLFPVPCFTCLFIAFIGMHNFESN